MKINYFLKSLFPYTLKPDVQCDLKVGGQTETLNIYVFKQNAFLTKFQNYYQ